MVEIPHWLVQTCGGKYYSELVSKIIQSLYGSLDTYTTILVLCEITEQEALKDSKPISADAEFLKKLITVFLKKVAASFKMNKRPGDNRRLN